MRRRVAMLLENNTYPEDVRVRSEAESLVRAGYAVCVIAPRGAGQPRTEFLRGVEVRRFRVPGGAQSARGLLLEYAIALLALHLAAMRELLRGAGVLHLHNPPDLLFGAALLARALGRRVVFDHHDLFPELVEVKFGARPLVAIARMAERATFALADKVLAANESHAELARSRGGKRAQDVVIVRNGPPSERLVPAPVFRPGRLEDPHLLYVGALAAQDGAELLADVLEGLREDHPGVRLTIVGDGPARQSVQQRLLDRGVAGHARITGWVRGEQVPALLAAADICVDPAPPSVLNDRSTMIKIAEYLAAGKPTVAFALPETARTANGSAWLASPGDVEDLTRLIATLATDPQARAELAQRAVRRAVSLTWDRSEAALLDAYERL